jgi:hypothetical protein
VRSITPSAVEDSPQRGRTGPLLDCSAHRAARRRLVRGDRRWLPGRGLL